MLFRSRLHHHPSPAAERRVVCGVMFIARPVTDVVNRDLDQAVLLGALKDAGFEIGREDFGQKCENFKLHEWILA